MEELEKMNSYESPANGGIVNSAKKAVSGVANTVSGLFTPNTQTAGRRRTHRKSRKSTRKAHRKSHRKSRKDRKSRKSQRKSYRKSRKDRKSRKSMKGGRRHRKSRGRKGCRKH